MYSSIATVCLSGSLEEKVDAIAQAGLKGLSCLKRLNGICRYTPRSRRAHPFPWVEAGHSPAFS